MKENEKTKFREELRERRLAGEEIQLFGKIVKVSAEIDMIDM